MDMLYRLVSVIVLGSVVVACGPDPVQAPPPPPDDPLPCTLTADQTRMAIGVGQTKPLVLTASKGDCAIERVRLDRDVFQIVAEPQWPFTIAGGASHTLTIAHELKAMLPPGKPIRELQFHGEGIELLVLLEGEPPPGDCISASPDSLLFTGVGLGETGRLAVAVKNDCTGDASITAAEIVEGDHSFSLGTLALPSTIPKGSTSQFGVTFAPIVSFPVGGRLELKTDQLQTPKLEVELVGVPRAPQILVFPEALALGGARGETPACGSRVETVRVANTGEADLEVAQLGTSDPAFRIVQARRTTAGVVDVTQAITMGPAEVLEIDVRYFADAGAAGPQQAELAIEHGAMEPTRATLRATRSPSRVTDAFTQPDLPKADVVFIVQDPSTMPFASTALLDFGTALLSGLEASDSRVAVTATNVDSPSAGRFDACRGNRDILRPDEDTLADREVALRCALGMPRYPARRSAGIEAGIRVVAGNLGGRIMRHDAAVALVVVSAEDDESATELDAAAAFFNGPSGRGRPDGVAIHAVTGPPAAPCAGASPGTRYRDAAARTAGRAFDICEADWTAEAAAIASTVVGPRASFALSAPADAASIEVSIDGARLQEGPRTYSYDAAANAITFAGPAVPRARQRVDVVYSVVCLP